MSNSQKVVSLVHRKASAQNGSRASVNTTIASSLSHAI